MLLSLCCSVVIMLCCYCVVLLLFVLSYVLVVCTVPLPPGVNPVAVDKYINKMLHVSTLEAGHHQAHVKIKSSNAVVDGIPSCTHLENVKIVQIS